MRYVETVRGKHPSSTPVALMLGHVMSLRSYFSGALGEYFQVYKRLPEDPLVLLLIGTHVQDKYRNSFGMLLSPLSESRV